MIKNNKIDDRQKNAYSKQVFVNDILVWEKKNKDYRWDHPRIPVFLNVGDNTITFKLNVLQSNLPVQVILDDVEIIPFDFDSAFNDTSVPISMIKPMSRYTNTNPFIIKWNGTDIGSGIAFYDIDYSLDEKNWIPLLINTKAESTEFTGEENTIYYFRCRAIDNAGNKEPVHKIYDTYTTLDYEFSKFELKFEFNRSTDTLLINLNSSEQLECVLCAISVEGYAEYKQVEMKSKNGYEWNGIYDVATTNYYHVIQIYAEDTSGIV